MASETPTPAPQRAVTIKRNPKVPSEWHITYPDGTLGKIWSPLNFKMTPDEEEETVFEIVTEEWNKRETQIQNAKDVG